MKKVFSLGALILLLALPGFSQVENVKLKVRAVLVDKDLNQKPAPRLSLMINRSDLPDAAPVTVRTNFDGMAELLLSPGKHRLSTPEPIEFQGKKYSWEMEMT